MESIVLYGGVKLSGGRVLMEGQDLVQVKVTCCERDLMNGWLYCIVWRCETEWRSRASGRSRLGSSQGD